MSILSQIISNKKKEVASAKKLIPLSVLRETALLLPPKKFGFQKALYSSGQITIIAEIKKKSPSRGIIRKDFNPVRIAREYDRAGAGALSVLTDRVYFGGDPSFIPKIKKITLLPVLRKDFIVDEYQVYESRILNADAILLIAAALPLKKLNFFYKTAQSIGLDVLFEVHDLKELRGVLSLKPKLVGVNNRDLKSFKVNLMASQNLSKIIPNNVIFVAESGIHTRQDLLLVQSYGADSALVGEGLMSKPSPGLALRTLLGKERNAR